MNEIIQLLFDNPIILIILGMWLLSGIGGIFAKAAKRAQEAQRKAIREERQGQRPQQTPQQQRPQVRPQPRPVVVQQPTQPRQPTPRTQRQQPPSPEDVAAEIRRIMGMEVEPRAPTAAPAPAPVPPPAAKRERVALRDQSRELGELRGKEKRIDHHLGEGLHERKIAGRGVAGARQAAGRKRRAGIRRRRSEQDAESLSSFPNLAKAFVIREVFSKPLALRGPDDEQFPF